MNRRSFFKSITGVCAGVFAAFISGKTKAVHTEEEIENFGPFMFSEEQEFDKDRFRPLIPKKRSGTQPVDLCPDCSNETCPTKTVLWTRSPDYEVGTRYVGPCGRTFRYAKWDSKQDPSWIRSR